VNYNGAGLTVKGVAYYNLGINASSGTTTISSGTTVANNLSITTLTSLGFNLSVSSLTLGGVVQAGGTTYGSSTSLAAHISALFTGSGIVTVASGASATKLVYTTVPSTGTTGTPFSVTVQAQDGSGNPTSPSSDTTITLTKASGAGTLSGTLTGTILASGNSVTIATPVYSGSDTLTLTATATAGMTSLTPVTSGSISFAAGGASAANSTVTASLGSVPADGSTTSTITVTLKDGGGAAVAGKTVTLAKSSGPGAPTITTTQGTSNSSGIATFTVKSLTAGTDVFQATDTSDSNLVITQTASVIFTALPASAANSTVTASPTSVTADGTSTSTVTVTLKDVNNAAVAAKTVTLAKSSGPGTPTITTTQGTSDASGVATFTVKSATVGADVFTATDTTDSNLVITPTATVTFTLPPLVANAGAAKSVNPSSPSTVIGGSPAATGGTGPYTYSWSPSTGLSDATAANPTATPGTTVTYTLTVTDSNSSQATSPVTVTYGVSAGSVISIDVVTATSVPMSGDVAGGLTGPQVGAWNSLVGSASLPITLSNLKNGAGGTTGVGLNVSRTGYGGFQAGSAPTGTGVVLSANNPERLWVSGAGVLTFKFTGLTSGASYSLAIFNTGSAKTVITTNGGTPHTSVPTILTTTEVADGSGFITVVVSFNGAQDSDYTEVSGFQLSQPGSAGLASKLAFTTVPATGTAGTPFSVTVQSQDAAGNPSAPTSDTTVTLSKASGGGTLSGTLTGIIPATGNSVTISTPVYSQSDTLTLTASATAGMTSLTPGTSTSVSFAVGAVSALTSTVTASPSSVPADGFTTSTITVTLKDGSSNPVTGKTVSLASSRGATDTISAASGSSDAFGVVTFSVKSSTTGAPVFTATDTSDSTVVSQTASVTFNTVLANPGNSTLAASPSSVPADGASTSTLTVTLLDSNNSPVVGKAVSLASSRGATDTISAASGASNASGVVTFTVKSSTTGSPTFTATDITDSNLIITPTATVTFTLPPLVGNAGAAKSVNPATPSAQIGGSPSASGGIGPYTYSWSPTAGLDDPTAANPTATPGQTKTYTLTVTDSSTPTPATATSSVTVTYGVVAGGVISIDAVTNGSVPVSGDVTGGISGQTGPWNALALTGSKVTLSGLKDGTGATTGIGFVFDSTSVGYHVQVAGSPYNPGKVLGTDNPERSWMTGGESPMTFKFTGLTPGAPYNLAIYTTGDSQMTLTVNGTPTLNPGMLFKPTATADGSGVIAVVVSCGGATYADYAEISGVQISQPGVGMATKLAYTTVPGTATAGTPFSVTVQSQDANGNPASPTSDTTVTLSVATGTGALSGTLTGIIPASGKSVTLTTPIYSTPETITLTASATAGMTELSPGTSGNIVFISAYAAWLSQNGLTASDANLNAFAFGTDPNNPSNAPITFANGVVTGHGLPVAMNLAVGSGVDYRAVFGRRRDYIAAGLTYTVQFSAGLDVWVDSQVAPEVLASDAEIDAVSVPYPLFIPTARGVEKPTFFRVGVSSN